MKKSYNHDQLEEVFQVLKNPQKYGSDFFQKYESNQQMLDLYNELRQYKESGQKLEQIDAPNIGLEWQKLTYKLKEQQRRKRGWMIAASVAVLLSCAFIFQFDRIVNQMDQDGNQLAQIEKGNSKALLITSGGNEYRLDEGINRIISEKEGVQIHTDSNHVVQYAGIAGESNENKLADMYNTLKVPRLGEYQLVLSDGTKVWLNSESELRYPVKFTGATREVELLGEAYFDVEKNPGKPFFVKTKSTTTRVLGTEFNVSAYPSEELNITLVEGSIELNSKQISGEVQLIPGDNANLKIGGDKIYVSQVDVRKYTAWRDGYFYFEKERLEDILTKLERWYDFKVFYQNPAVKDYAFRMRADRNEDFAEIVSRLEQTGRISMKLKGNVIVVSDVNR
ncbi:FecR family protein [Labilibaculum manganireducens]|uniref:FecR family protein n=1 Tax=Labilibaculum manganireducens TaxID=1940525 RepID=UPI0029F4B7ED|nr:FecR family protein [Labilibaculum manganireducens]